jgi:NAD(P)H-hydrate epimerase
MIPKKRAENAYKNQFGRVVVIGGSYSMSGAVQLAAAAVLRAGAGLTVLASTRDVINRIGGFIPEAMFAPLDAADDGSFSGSDAEHIPSILEKADAVLFGNGVTKSPGAKKILEAVLKSETPIKIIDADGINLIADNIQLLKEAKGTTVLTPHEGELERLCNGSGEAPAGKSRGSFAGRFSCERGGCEYSFDRSEAAKRIFAEYGAIVVAKGVPTYICEKTITAVSAGNPGLAKGGSGDVLAGIIAAFSVKENAENIAEALKVAVAVHGKAADIACEKYGETAMVASDVIAAIPEAIIRICYHE